MEIISNNQRNQNKLEREMRKTIILIFCILSILIGQISAKQDRKNIAPINVKVTTNPEKGLWEGDPQKSIRLIYTLTIGNEHDNNSILYKPLDIAVDREMNIFVLDSGSNCIKKFDNNGKYLKTIGQKGEGPGDLLQPQGLAIDDEDIIYVADAGNQRIQIFARDGNYLKIFKTLIPPINLELDSKGFIYVRASSFLQTQECLIHKYNNKGEFVKSFVKSIKDKNLTIANALNLLSLAIDHKDNIYVCYHYDKYSVNKYDSEGNLILRFNRVLPYSTHYPEETKMKTQAGNWNIGVFTFRTLLSIATDKNGLVYVLLGGKDGEYLKDDGNLVIDIFNSEGIYLGKVNTGRTHITKIYIDKRNNLYAVDGYNSMKVYRYSIKMGE
jgi:hypothetical protein